MSYEWPDGLTPLRNWLKEQGVDVTSIVSERQAAFFALKLSGQRIKFPTDRSAPMFPILLRLQGIICAGAATPRPAPSRGQPFVSKQKGKAMKRAAAKAPTWLRTIAAEKFDPQGNRSYRERQMGTFGAASPVRRIDPDSKGKA